MARRGSRVGFAALAAAVLGAGVAAQQAASHPPHKRASAAQPGKMKGSVNPTLTETLAMSKIISHVAERRALWAGLQRLWPSAFPGGTGTDLRTGRESSIAIYAENASSTELCFLAAGDPYTYDAQDGKIEHISMAQVLPPVNAITYARGRDPQGPTFLLWSNGTAVAAIGATRP